MSEQINHKKVEVSAILEADGFWSALAISPGGICYVYSPDSKLWVVMMRHGYSGLQYWNRRAYDDVMSTRRIYRGIFTIKVAAHG